MKKREMVEVGTEDFTLNDKLDVDGVKIHRQYMIDTMTYKEHKFVGELLPLPMVLVKYLNATELKVFTFILGKLTCNHCCYCRREAIGKELNTSVVTVSKILTTLESMGIITQTRVGMRLDRKINFDTIQALNDLLADRLPGAVAAFRSAMGSNDIRRPTPYAMALLEEKYTKKYGEEAEAYDE